MTTRPRLLIFSASTACLDAFGIPKTSLDLADDDHKLRQLLPKPPGDVDVDDDYWHTQQEEFVRRKVAALFQRADIRAAAQALAERLIIERTIEGYAIERLIDNYLERG